ncbi:uncharacterized protein F5891DRAFT_978077 [Suillus fuscotomentosus]|uniref:Uncharacterized protein n=1 Tax=Suillus fuscotomentosus TaxID=1912939 RepID=A0AAD4HNE7_9AGAM|nr:uncharacterized protein F5891DRAFT_978077 [Suillus fuscotomentosus]KAG1903028.1 hypothetical protein F5891DRAFT_978077 [Suillus fuscotomentosus]
MHSLAGTLVLASSHPSIPVKTSTTHPLNTKVRVVSDDLASNQSSSAQRGSSALRKVAFPSMLDFLNSSEREHIFGCIAECQDESVQHVAPSNIKYSWHQALFQAGKEGYILLKARVHSLTSVKTVTSALRRLHELCAPGRNDILRIPLPEGLAPLSPQSLDESLTKLIDNYTMRGLVACCWVLKIGLCGWINVDLSPNPAEDANGLENYARRDTLQLVERAITVVRRRRSVKAIETLEQVQFLTEYVEKGLGGTDRRDRLWLGCNFDLWL